MSRAASIDDPAAFFRAANAALQHAIAFRLDRSPATVSARDLEPLAKQPSTELRTFFDHADRVAYAGQTPTAANYAHYERVLRTELRKMEVQ